MQAVVGVSFFQVMVEILKVEISLLLNDALSIMHASSTSTAESNQDSVAEPVHASPLQPEAQTAPAAQSPTNASPAAPDRDKTGSPHAANPSTDHSTDHSKPLASDAGTLSSGGSGVHNHASISSLASSPSNTKYSSSEQTPAAPGVEDAASTGDKQRDHRTSSPAADRVTGVLPAVFFLMEGCLQALAADAQAGEDAPGGSRLDDEVAQRAMQALSEAFETVLQFLELVHAEGLGQESPWLLAAVRAVGRQVPNALLLHDPPIVCSSLCHERSVAPLPCTSRTHGKTPGCSQDSVKGSIVSGMMQLLLVSSLDHSMLTAARCGLR